MYLKEISISLLGFIIFLKQPLPEYIFVKKTGGIYLNLNSLNYQ